MAAGADIVHAYRRLSAEEEQMSESNYGDSSSSSRKKSGGQSQSSRQQLPAKFECVAWSVLAESPNHLDAEEKSSLPATQGFLTKAVRNVTNSTK